MDISLRSKSFTADDHSWLGSAHGTEATQTVTLDTTKFSDVTFAADSSGRRVIPAGVTLAKITATGLYGPYDDTAVDGRAVMVGHLFTSARAQVSTVAGAKVGAAILLHGQVVEAKLPTGHGLDAAGKVDVSSRIIYR